MHIQDASMKPTDDTPHEGKCLPGCCTHRLQEVQTQHRQVRGRRNSGTSTRIARKKKKGSGWDTMFKPRQDHLWSLLSFETQRNTFPLRALPCGRVSISHQDSRCFCALHADNTTDNERYSCRHKKKVRKGDCHQPQSLEIIPMGVPHDKAVKQ